MSRFLPGLKFAVAGVQRARKQLELIAEEVLAPVVALRIEQRILKNTKERFVHKRSPNGVPWAPLSTAAIERRARLRKSAKYFPTAFGLAHYGILVSTGQLADSIRIFRTGESRGKLMATGAGFRIGTNHPAARMHQYGTNKVPARPFLGFTRFDVGYIERLLMNQSKRAGLS